MRLGWGFYDCFISDTMCFISYSDIHLNSVTLQDKRTHLLNEVLQQTMNYEYRKNIP